MINKYNSNSKQQVKSPFGTIVSAVILTILWHIFLYAVFVDRDQEELCPECRKMEYRRPGIEDANYRQYPRRKKNERDNYTERRYVIS